MNSPVPSPTPASPRLASLDALRGFDMCWILGAEHGRAAAVKRVLIRAAVLFLLGIFYSGGLTGRWPDIRLLGVRQRIALVYGAAGACSCWRRFITSSTCGNGAAGASLSSGSA